jgi:cytochrome c oxidase assembly protein subunit 15
MPRTLAFKPGLFALCLLTLFPTALLLTMGAHTTSIQAGMAFLDWPLSEGSVNPEGWLSDPKKFAEHSHRLLGALVGLLAILIAGWTYVRDERLWTRRLAFLFLFLVIAQGVMGGMRVLFDQLNTQAPTNVLAQSYAVVHAVGAQVVLGCLVALCACQSRSWIGHRAGFHGPVPRAVRIWGLLACASLLLQAGLGAVQRHIDAGMAIPYFPAGSPSGSLLPDAWNWPVIVNFGHRVGAIVAAVLLVVFLVKLYRCRQTGAGIRALVVVPALLLFVQIHLGALTIWSLLNSGVATAHMLYGAALISTTWLLTFLTFRFPISARGVRVPPVETAHEPEPALASR